MISEMQIILLFRAISKRTEYKIKEQCVLILSNCVFLCPEYDICVGSRRLWSWSTRLCLPHLYKRVSVLLELMWSHHWPTEEFRHYTRAGDATQWQRACIHYARSWVLSLIPKETNKQEKRFCPISDSFLTTKIFTLLCPQTLSFKLSDIPQASLGGQ